MKFQEILEACWSGYQQQGMKKKGNRQVPNCVKVSEIKVGPEMSGKDLLFTAAAKAIHQAWLEGQPMDYDEAIKKAAKIYRIPYTPSELPRLLAQRAEIDRKLAMMKQGKQVTKQRRQEKLAPTPAGSEEWHKAHALTVDRIKPPTRTLEETEAELAEDLKKWFKEKWVRFGPDGKIRGDCARGSESEGKPKCLPQSKAHALGKKGRASAAAKKRREDPNPERRGPARNVATRVKEGYQDFNKVEPYEVCLAGRPVKQFDYYEDARRFHDNWKKKLYREGNKEKADKITLNPIMKETATAPIIVPKRKRKEKPEPKFHIPYSADDYVPPAVQIARDEAAKKNKEVKEDQGSWIVYDPKTKQIKRRFKTHTAGKSYAKVHGLGFASSEYYFDNVKGKEPQLNEYFVRSGDDIMSLMSLNLFKDLLGDASLSDYDKEFANSPKWQAVVAEWQPKAEYIQKQLAKYQNTGRKLRDAEADAIDDTVYDGGDAYEDAETAASYLPKVYKKQASAIVRLLKDGYATPPAGMHEEDDWSDEEDDRLHDGDYVRDRQDGEYGEIFRMSGDPSERRVRILDRDGRGWYISPDRLEAVDPTDPDIQKYFGKKRRQDIDEKQDACYRKVKSRYKVWPSAYASGALVQCRKKGAANWGNKSKK